MNDNEKALMHQLEMAAHSQGTAQFLYDLFGGRLITKDQARETMEFFKAQMKRNIEGNSTLTREQKDNEISIREAWFEALKASWGL
ncbi:MAG: hypothetical protein IKX35_02040 [Bacteroidales bacterium]|nr:hypothetical protein [Bacteroidales bacterium]